MLEADWKPGSTPCLWCLWDMGLIQSPGLPWPVLPLSYHGEENLTLVSPPLISVEVRG